MRALVRHVLGGVVERLGRLNAFVISGFAGVALLIAVVGVAGVLRASSASAWRSAPPRAACSFRVLFEGAVIVVIGIVAGPPASTPSPASRGAWSRNVHPPGALAIAGATAVLVGAGVLASLMPAARASHVDVMQALPSEWRRDPRGLRIARGAGRRIG